MLNNSVFDTTSIVNTLPSIDRSSIFDDSRQTTIQYINNKDHNKHDHTVPLSGGFPFLFILILIYSIYKNARRSKRTIQNTT